MVKRKRKPMTEEQRAAAVERLRIAREKRGHDGSASVHESLLTMSEDSPIHWKKVRGWIKEINEELRAKKSFRISKESKERLEYQTLEVYVANLKRYLDSGIYLDNRYGRHREGKMTVVVTTMSYHDDGLAKRTLGWFYPDVGEWTEEMHSEYCRIRNSEHG
jgi:hypothetical protein